MTTSGRSAYAIFGSVPSRPTVAAAGQQRRRRRGRRLRRSACCAYAWNQKRPSFNGFSERTRTLTRSHARSLHVHKTRNMIHLYAFTLESSTVVASQWNREIVLISNIASHTATLSYNSAVNRKKNALTKQTVLASKATALSHVIYNHIFFVYVLLYIIKILVYSPFGRGGKCIEKGIELESMSEKWIMTMYNLKRKCIGCWMIDSAVKLLRMMAPLKSVECAVTTIVCVFAQFPISVVSRWRRVVNFESCQLKFWTNRCEIYQIQRNKRFIY